MSKQVYVPVAVDEGGAFCVDFDGAPWMYVESEANVWNPDAEEWEPGSIESDNASLVDDAESRIALADKVLRSLEAWVHQNATHYECEELMLYGSGADHASFLYELIDRVAQIKVDFPPAKDD
jgi:hypothetical protein